MTMADLLAHLRARGVELTVEEDQLRVRAPKGILSAELRSELAGRKEELLATLRASARPLPSPCPRDRDLPLSVGQQRLWELERAAGPSAVYNIAVACRLRGELDGGALAASLEALVRRHEPLRTRFPARGGQPVQEIRPHPELPVAHIDLTALPAPRRPGACERLGGAAARRPFDLERGPLLRALLVRLTPREHLLLLIVHHIVFDAWSIGVVVRDLGALYLAARGAAAARLLPPLPIQHADFAVWQRRCLDGGLLERALDAWRQRLAAPPEPFELPADRPHRGRRGHGGMVRQRLAPTVRARLAALARHHRASIFMVLLAVFKTLIYRLSGSTDLVVGSPVTGRHAGGLDQLVGYFVNTLALRTRLRGDRRFCDHLDGLRRTVLDAFADQDVPLETLLADPQLRERLILRVFFQQLASPPPASPAVSSERAAIVLEEVEIELETAKVDLAVTLAETAEGIHGGWRYDRDLFDRTTIRRLVRHFETLLAAALAAPEQRLADLALLTPGERHQLCREPTPAGPALPPTATLTTLFARQAAARADASALRCAQMVLSYGELGRRSAVLARRLRGAGIGRGSRVGLFLERDVAQVVAILATLRAGAAYVPLDPAYPESRRRLILDDAAVDLVLTQPSLRGELAAGMPVMTLATGGGTGADEEEDGSTVPGPTADDLAYLIYTSGSTGRPKGVAVCHAHVARLLSATAAWFGFGPSDAWTLFHSYAFDFSVWEIWGALAFGGRLEIVPYWSSRAPEAFRELLGRARITVLNQTPSAFRQLIRADEAAANRDLALRWVIFGGEALEPDSLAPWIAVHGDERPRLVNMYGITETTVHVTGRRIVRADLERHRSVIGPPIPDLELYVLDERLRLRPLGVVGELHVGGAGVARGYWRRPARTAERFVPDPFSGRPGGRLYRSGDLGRRLADGDVAYLGRGDAQIKIRGFRIELGDVESALARHPAVREAVVVCRGERSEQRTLAAYVVTRDGEEVELTAVRRFLAPWLPDYMLPSALVRLDTLPLTTHGKVDRRALPEPTARPAGATSAPRTALGSFLAELWHDVLGLPRSEPIGVDDDFFQLGGNSILGARLVNRLQQELGEIVQVVTIFDAPTIARLAAYLRAEHPRALMRLFGSAADVEHSSAPPRAAERVNETDAALLGRLIEPLAPFPLGPRNPRAIFVLAPPRSGTTLLRVLLAGHPRLFAPPELELLSFNTMAERRTAFSGRDSFWLEGLVRAVMEARRADTGAAAQILEREEVAGTPTQEIYRRLQGWLAEAPGGGRILVDKTPSYALDPQILQRAEEVFANSFYVHLIRHPCGMIHSFEEAKLDQLFWRRRHPFTRRQLAELIWLISHRNVLRFFAQVPAERRHRVVFEELVRRPRAVLEELCARLGLPFDPRMLEPYADGSSRMTDGPHRASRMLGDVKFHQHRRIEPGVAERWRRVLGEDDLGEPTRRLAAELVPELRARLDAGRTAGRLAERPRPPAPWPLSYHQERLWFLHQWEPESPSYHIPLAFRAVGELRIDALVAAFDHLTRRHEALRTTFATRDGQAVQEIAAAPPRVLATVDLGALGPAARRSAARRGLRTAARQPFDLAAGPLLRVVVLRCGPGEHQLLLVMHHIVSDGASMRILMREVTALYRAAVEPAPERRRPALPALPAQPVDFALWQRRRLSAARLEALVDGWRARLEEAPAALELPTDRPRSQVPRHRAQSSPLRLSRPESEAVHALARRSGTTRFMVLLAAFETTLMRLAGGRDVVVGSPVAGRNHRDLEGLIGFFVNTLALRLDLRHTVDPAFGEILEQMRRVVTDALAHQDLPFERLVEELSPERRPERHPIFQVVFTLQDAPSEPLELPGLRLEPLEVGALAAKFDLTWTLWEGPEGFTGGVERDVDLFDEVTVRRFARCFRTLLAAAMADPQRPWSGLPLLDAGQRHQLLHAWNDTATPSPRRASLPELFARGAGPAGTPEAVAVVAAGVHLSYGELARRAGGLARELRRRGVTAEAVVGLALERSPDFIVATLAVLAAGGVYLPLDPSYPAARLAWMARHSGAAWILASGELPAELGAGPWQVLRPDPGLAAGFAAARIHPQQLAYVMYTSGSTGQPKGVAVTHRNVVRLVCGTTAFATGPQEVFLQLAATSFDAATFEIWGALLHGARLVLAPAETPTLAALGELLDRERVSTLWLTAGLFHQVVDESPGILAPLRQLLAGGEALSADHVRRALGSRCAVINGYGPTENTTFTCCHPVRSLAAGAVSVPIGRPISETRAYVLEASGELAPVGVAGQLAVGGDGLARGYLHAPRATAERFLPDARSGLRGARLYATGDRVRQLGDGTLDFLGRIDRQVKIRGFRIEPGEIETVLTSLAGVRRAAVVARDEPPLGKRLLAYVVGDVDSAALRQELGARLPDYLVPDAIALLDELPLTANGKVDRAALPPVAHDTLQAVVRGPADAVLPAAVPSAHTAYEELVAGLWQELLGVERVDRHDDFFALGGHSLLATRFLAHLERATGARLTLRELFTAPTPAAIAARVAAGRGTAARRPPLRRARSGRRRFPLSFAQERLWFLAQLEPDNPAYHVPVALRLRGTLAAAALGRALQWIVERHASLRTSFAARDGRPVQILHATAAVPWGLVDLAALAPAAWHRERARLLRRESRRPFDLAAGLLLRPLLLRRHRGEHLLFVNFHHIATDGWSMSILVRELSAAFAAFAAGRRPQLPALPVRYADFAVWQRTWLRGAELERQLAHWRRALSGAPSVLELPTDRPRTARSAAHGAQRPVFLPLPWLEALGRLGRQAGTTLFMTLAVGFAAVLARTCGRHDLILGTPVANRPDPALEGLIGFFVNTLALRFDLGGDPDGRTLLARARRTILDAYDHQDLPFERLVDALGIARRLDVPALVQVMLVLQNVPSATLHLPGVELDPVEVTSGAAKLDLTVRLAVTADGLRGVAEYRSDLFDATTVQRLVSHFEDLLGELAAAPERRLGELRLLRPAQHHQCLIEWNDPPAATTPAGRRGGLLHEMLARREPDAIALVEGEQALTCGELAARSDRLAHLLRRHGVGPERCVAVHAERSLATLTGIWAILKAGGAYVPIDLEGPPYRSRQILDAARPVLLLARPELASGHAVPHLDPAAPVDVTAPPSGAPPSVAPENAAYVIFTSGSTGSPKGVVVEHRQVTAYTEAIRARLGLADGARYAALQPLTFDSAGSVLFPALGGGSLILVAAGQALDAGALADLFVRRRIDVVKITPSHLLTLGEAPAGEESRPPLPARRLIFGGEALPRTWAQRLAAVGACRVLNHYGPTEATVGVLTSPVRPNSPPRRTATVPIGRPLAHARALVLSRELRLQPCGIPGELYLGGRCLARGYLGDPALTAQRFLPDPFAPAAQCGERIYRSGDLVRRHGDGEIEFLGRIDHQIKVHGVRVELGEIEAALRELPAVREAVVVLRPEDAAVGRLTAYVAAASGMAISPEQLRRQLRERLPEVMVPATIVQLAALPRTAHAKVDRAALPAPPPAHQGGAAAGARALPRDAIELRLAGLWSELLNLAEIDTDADFFALGGHSLLAIRLLAAVERGFGCRPPLELLFARPTVAGLATWLRAHPSARGERSLLVRLRPAGSAPPFAAVHPVGGEVYCYLELARRLESERPFWALQAPPPGPGAQDVEDLAKRYLDALGAAEAPADTVLGGWSMGAVVAYEMARRKASEDAGIPLVVMIDPPPAWRPRPAPTEDHAALLASFLGDLTGTAPETFSAELRGLDDAAQLARARRLATAVGALPDELELELFAERFASFRRNFDAVRRYVPRPAPVRLVVLRAHATAERHPRLGWDELAAEAEVHVLPGDHHTLLRPPQVGELAQHLAAALAAPSRGAHSWRSTSAGSVVAARQAGTEYAASDMAASITPTEKSVVGSRGSTS